MLGTGPVGSGAIAGGSGTSYASASGTASGIGNTSGGLTGLESASGTATGAALDTGLPSGAAAISGAGAGVSADTATPSGAVSASGTAVGLSADTAMPSGAASESGTAAALGSGIGTLSNGSTLGGNAQGASAAQATPSGAEAGSGAATASASDTATIGGTGGLSGAAPGVAAAQDTLQGAESATGTAAATSAAQGTPSALDAAQGTAPGQSAATGTLTAGVSGGLQGAAIATSSAVATPTAFSSPGIGFAATWQLSGRIIAGVLGLPFQQFRPSDPENPLAAPLRSINAWITRDPTLMESKPFDRAKPDEVYAGLDPALTQPGDYLVGSVTLGGAVQTFFIATQDVPAPIRLVRCDRVLTFERAPITQSFGANSYGGQTIADRTTILTGWPAGFVQGTKGEAPAPSTKLPGDARLPWWTAMLPATPGVTLNMGDHATDDLGRDFTISSAELTTFGWRLTLMLSST